MSPARYRDATAAAAMALVAGALAAGLVASGIRLTEEDGFYYFKIAQHVAAGLGSTFDGLHRTNGYQPLWLLCLVPVFRLWPAPHPAMEVATVLQGLLLALTSALVYRLSRAWLPRSSACLAGILWVAVTYRVSLSGVEFALVGALVTSVALVLVHGCGGPSPRRGAYPAMGVLLALSVLARLDLLLLAVLVAGELSVRARARPRAAAAAARVAALWIPVFVVGSAYLLANATLFGHPLPVSGVAKRVWSAHLLRQDPIYLSDGWLAAKVAHVLRPLRHPSAAGMATIVLGGGLPIALLALQSAGARGRALTRWTRGIPGALRPLVLFAALQPLIYALVYHGHYSYAPWYFAVPPLLAVLLAPAFADAVGRTLERAVAARAPVAAAAALITAAVLTIDATRWQARAGARDGPLYMAARWARDNLPADARVGAWSAGAIGYLSERQVVNLDGVVNTVEYLRREQYDLCAYWRRTGITHLVDVFEAREGSTSMLGTTLPVSRFYADCVPDLELLWSERIPGNPGWPKAFRLRAAVSAER